MLLMPSKRTTKLFDELWTLGTTTCCYYGSLHLKATEILADIAHAKGQRAFIGKCNMDSPETLPEYYRDQSAEQSLHETRSLIKHIRGFPSHGPHQLVQPIITPRFALGCTREMLTDLGSLANEEPDLCIQTHISENVQEVEAVKEAFPESKTYAGVYDHYHLLRHNTILGHGVHLEDDELTLIKERGAGVAHCPTSNFNLRSGIAHIGKYLDRGIKVGLGTDVSGGFSPSMLTAIRDASVASKVIAFLPVLCPHASEGVSATSTDAQTQFSNKQLSVATLLYLATLGGAHLCNIHNQVGSFKAGKGFDALLVSVQSDTGNLEVWQEKESLPRMLECFFYCGDDRNIRKVWVQGKLVGGATLD
ncbi:hypothetical protein HGRIS_012902 [Hohenbuehelia grisea]